MDHIELQGLRVPTLGFGSMTLKGDDGIAAIRFALEIGYRHIDTAANYANEAEVGQAMKVSGVPRSFRTSQVFNLWALSKALLKSNKPIVRFFSLDKGIHPNSNKFPVASNTQ